MAYFQSSVRLIIPETSLSLNSKQDDTNEINWMLIKKAVEFIRCDNKVTCDCTVNSSSLRRTP